MRQNLERKALVRGYTFMANRPTIVTYLSVQITKDPDIKVQTTTKNRRKALYAHIQCSLYLGEQQSYEDLLILSIYHTSNSR